MTIEPLRRERDNIAHKLSEAHAGRGPHDPLTLRELALQVAVFDHAIDLFSRLPFQVAVGHVERCSTSPCHQFGAYGFTADRVQQVVAATFTRALAIRRGDLTPGVPGRRGVWCSYLEHSAERGTVLEYGYMVAAGDTNVLIRREGARQIERFLRLWPHVYQQEPYVRVPRSSVNFQPLRREGEPPWQVRNRLHLGAKRTSPRQVDDVVMVLKVDLMGRWGLAEQGVVTEVFPPGEKYAYAVTFAGTWELPDFLGGGPAARVYCFRANEVSGPVPPDLAQVYLIEPPPDPSGPSTSVEAPGQQRTKESATARETSTPEVLTTDPTTPEEATHSQERHGHEAALEQLAEGSPNGTTVDQQRPGPPPLEDPPVPPGHIRLYRGEIVPATSTQLGLPEMRDDGAERLRTLPAPWRDRRFTRSRARVAEYLGGGRFGGDYTRRVKYVDLPIEAAAQWSLTNRFNRELDEARAHSRSWDEDYLLPPEVVERAAELLPRPVDGTHLRATSAGGEDHGRDATGVTASRPTPHWVRADEVQPGDVVELTYGNGKLLEVEWIERDIRMVQGVAEPVVVFHGWMLDPDTGREWRVDDATWGVTSPLWWLENLREQIERPEAVHPYRRVARDVALAPQPGLDMGPEVDF